MQALAVIWMVGGGQYIGDTSRDVQCTFCQVHQNAARVATENGDGYEDIFGPSGQLVKGEYTRFDTHTKNWVTFHCL